MKIKVLGLDHHQSPIELRGQVTFFESEIPAALQQLCYKTNTEEAIILSTCNRTEIYYYGDALLTDICQWLSNYKNLDHSIVSDFLYFFEGEEAITHLMRVSCSLESMVLGEPQIFGQLKQAAKLAESAGTLKTYLSRLTQYTFAATKKARSRTKIGHCPVSVAFSAVKIAKHNTYPAKQVLILGAGKTAALVAKHLRHIDYQKLTIINRTFEKADTLAKQVLAESETWDNLPNLMKQVDLIITATSAPEPVITETMLTDAIADRNHDQKLQIIDLSVPNNVCFSAKKMKQIEYYNVDNIQQVIKDNIKQRKDAISAVEAMIKETHAQFLYWFNTRQSVHNLKALRTRTIDLCDAELEKWQHKIDLGECPKKVLDQFAKSLTNKWLHAPYVNVSKASQHSQALASLLVDNITST